MPQRPIEQDRRDTGRLWPTTGKLSPPIQPRYVGCRSTQADGRSWADLSRHPASNSARRHLGTR